MLLNSNKPMISSACLPFLTSKMDSDSDSGFFQYLNQTLLNSSTESESSDTSDSDSSVFSSSKDASSSEDSEEENGGEKVAHQFAQDFYGRKRKKRPKIADYLDVVHEYSDDEVKIVLYLSIYSKTQL